MSRPRRRLSRCRPQHARRLRHSRMSYRGCYINTQESTPNGVRLMWIVAINQVLEDRESDSRITDLDDDIWEKFLGPLIDFCEDNPGYPQK